MKKISVFTAVFFSLLMISTSSIAQVASVRDSLGGAPVPPEIEDPECIGINKEPAHAT
jgi:beta-galactosidase